MTHHVAEESDPAGRSGAIELRTWLRALDLEHFAAAFEALGIGIADLSGLDEADLAQYGHLKIPLRHQDLLAAIASLPRPGAGVSAPKPPWPTGLDPAIMPTYLAQPWSALLAEEHPRVRLHWLVDTAELAVRWTVAIALSEVVHACDGIPVAVGERIRDHVQRPTLGRWLGILRELSNARPTAALLTDGVFDLYATEFLPRFRPAKEGEGGGTLETSLLVLRNQLAHGGGLSTRRSSELLQVHLPGLQELLRAVLAVTVGVDPIAAECGNARRLVDVLPAPCLYPAILVGREDGAWLVGPAAALALWPIACFGPVQLVDAHGVLRQRPGESTAQVYSRSGRDSLSFTPLGRDEAHSDVLDESTVERFRELFHLDAESGAGVVSHDPMGFAWDDFLQEARGLAEEMVGRADELSVAKNWLKGRAPHEVHSTRLGWIAGGPGAGKSMLMATLAATYHQPRHRGLFYHRFRAGDARNSRRAFLRHLQAALWAWEPLATATGAPSEDAGAGQALEDDVRSRLAAIAQLEPPDPQAPRRAFWILADGLDEVVSGDPTLQSLLRDLAVPGTVWLVAGRPEHGIGQALSQTGCEALFSEGLPPMSAVDIRAMLLQGLGPAKYGLLRRDEDVGDDVRNAFIDCVVDRAHGLPLYVHLLLEDLRSGRLGVGDEGRLPDGLTAYYTDLVRRMGIGTVTADLTLIVALLARSEEPVDTMGLSVLLARGPSRVARFLPRVQAALRVGQSLLRREPSPESDSAWSLYHQSFREYVGGSPQTTDRAGRPPAETLRGVVRDAEELLADLASEWRRLTEHGHRALRNHLFRWGTEYAVWWRRDEGVAEAACRLSDFAYLDARTAALPASETTDLLTEYALLLDAGVGEDLRRLLQAWQRFFLSRSNLLRRGHQDWPTNRILLQMAMEADDDSVPACEAARWIRDTCFDGLWLRSRRRRDLTEGRAPTLVLEMDERVNGALEVSSRGLATWGYSTLRLWDLSNGDPGPVLELSGRIEAVHRLGSGSLFAVVSESSGSERREIHLWDGQSRHLLPLGEDGPGAVRAAASPVFLPGGGVAAEADGPSGRSVAVWDACGGPIRAYAAFRKRIWGLSPVGGTVLAIYGDERAIHLWNWATGETTLLAGHRKGLRGLTVLPGGRLLTSSLDSTLRLWEVSSGACIGVFEGLRRLPSVEVIDDAEVVASSGGHEIAIWGLVGGAAALVFTGHTATIDGVLRLGPDHLVSWAANHEIRLWNIHDASCEVVWKERRIRGCASLDDRRTITWSAEGRIRVWEVGHDSAVAQLRVTPEIRDLEVDPDGGIRFADGANRRLRWVQGDIEPEVLFATDPGEWLLELGDGRHVTATDQGLKIGPPLAPEGAAPAALTGSATAAPASSWVRDGLAFIDRSSGEAAHEISGTLLEELSDGRLLVARANARIVFDGATGAELGRLRGHTRPFQGPTVLGDGRWLTFSVAEQDARIWDPTTLTCAAHFAAGPGSIESLRPWGPDRLFASVEGGGGEARSLEGEILAELVLTQRGSVELRDRAGSCDATLPGPFERINVTPVDHRRAKVDLEGDESVAGVWDVLDRALTVLPGWDEDTLEWFILPSGRAVADGGEWLHMWSAGGEPLGRLPRLDGMGDWSYEGLTCWIRELGDTLVAVTDREILTWSLDSLAPRGLPGLTAMGPFCDPLFLGSGRMQVWAGLELLWLDLDTGRCLDRVPADEAPALRTEGWNAYFTASAAPGAPDRRHADWCNVADDLEAEPGIYLETPNGAGRCLVFGEWRCWNRGRTLYLQNETKGIALEWHCDDLARPLMIGAEGVVLAGVGTIELYQGGQRVALSADAGGWQDVSPAAPGRETGR